MKEHICPICSKELFCIIEEMTLTIKCTQCGPSASTSIFNKISNDENIYEIIIEDISIYDYNVLRNIFNYSRTEFHKKYKNKKNIEKLENSTGSKIIIDKLIDEKISYSVNPKFNWSNGQHKYVDIF